MKSTRYPMLVAVVAALIYVILHPLSWHKLKSDTTFTFEQQSADTTPLPAGDQLNVEMRRLADKAVENARVDHRITLDYSDTSIAKVEDILGKLHDRNLPDDALRPLAVRYGAYVGEVLRGKTKGQWETVVLEPHEPGVSGEHFAVRQPSGALSFPIDKAFKRLTNGDEDNIEMFFRFIVKDPDFATLKKK